MSKLAQWLKGLWTNPVKELELNFVFTKKKGRKGAVVLHIEQREGETYSCTKGSFKIVEGKLVWVRMKNSDLITLSSSDIDTFLDDRAAETLINKLILNVKK
jgi:hypothetical protein